MDDLSEDFLKLKLKKTEEAIEEQRRQAEEAIARAERAERRVAEWEKLAQDKATMRAEEQQANPSSSRKTTVEGKGLFLIKGYFTVRNFRV